MSSFQVHRGRRNHRRRYDRPRYALSWGIIVLDPQNRVLLLKHRQGHWTFCKGGKELGDTSPIHTAARELLEETGLRVPKLWVEEESWSEYCSATELVRYQP
ncbi:hypothetical protein L914_11980 [Phytophthora nicotianae]|uniref:Nudix hydrolase domain-containing protein n=3 Tax=Phytophthora nicotianae TaxID=4792 RepID=V9EUD5_PHYNI|nr:hypothetical protein F443_12421 [Phytophthora nicotianae P1569]ETM42366.1 hypothetical protein L914_11980 [Phytophthora nicotianae]ETO71090.1 hypothetical protein F444_12523 [Phytophthora nicotianae P1976]